MSALRITALGAVVFLVVPGCYEDHGRTRTGMPTPARPDAGVGPVVDAAPRRDAPYMGIDAPPTCPLVRADASCLSSFAMPAGVPFELPFQFDGCACCSATSCDVSVDAAARTLRLGTHLCPDPCDCDACNTPRGTCAVPPLPLDSLGQWTVEVNGVPAFVIGVIDTFDPDLGPPPGCATYAERDTCGATPDFTTGPVRGDCVDHATLADREVVRIHDYCLGCGELDSECGVIVQPRLTDDLPPGGDIILHARTYTMACDVDCPDVCVEHVRECALPELLPGGFYRVRVDGEIVASFTQGAPDEPCVRD